MTKTRVGEKLRLARKGSYSTLGVMKNRPCQVAFKTLGLVICMCLLSIKVWAEQHRQSSLTLQEREYIEQRGKLRVGADPNWPPFSFFDETGEFTGIDHEFLTLIQQHTGLQYEFIRTDSWEETYGMAQQGELDLVCGFSKSEEREKQFVFTQPYLSYPLAIITRSEHPLIIDIRFNKNRRYVLPDAHVTTERLIRDFPELNITTVPSSRDSLTWVSRRKADATLENLVSAKAIIREHGLTNLKIGGISSYRFELHFAVPREEVMLQRILNKGLARISEQEQFSILNRWIEVEHDPLIIWENVWKTALLLGILVAGIIIFITYWNRKLSAEIDKRREVESRLRRANEEKDFVMSMVAHDLNNPLTVMEMQLELMEDANHGQPGLTKMRTMVSRISRLIRQLVLLKTLEKKAKAPDADSVDINALVSDVVAIHRTRALQKDIFLDYQPVSDQNSPLLKTNQDALIQIMENLISNAIKFSPKGKTVRVAICKNADKIEICVKDEGPGISAQEQQKLFKEPVAPINQPTGGESSSGLGLWISHNLIQRLGGRLTCSSQKGEGTEFTVILRQS